jgi:hypothetical protein
MVAALPQTYANYPLLYFLHATIKMPLHYNKGSVTIDKEWQMKWLFIQKQNLNTKFWGTGA